jgi:tetratricopeptide (TPR) repeat protein
MVMLTNLSNMMTGMNRRLVHLLAAVSFAAALSIAADDSWTQGVARFKTSKDWNGMVAYTTRWTQAKPQEGMAWCLRGFAYGKLRQWDPAKQNYDHCLGLIPHDETAWTLAASSYFDAWKFGSAIALLKDGAAKNPNSARIWENLGFDYGDLADAQIMQHSKVGDADGLTANQNLDLAKQALSKALALGSKNHIDMWRQLGQWEVDLGEDWNAMRNFFLILKELPHDRNALHGLAVANGYLKGQCVHHDIKPAPLDPEHYTIVGPAKWTCTAEMQEGSRRADAMVK